MKVFRFLKACERGNQETVWIDYHVVIVTISLLLFSRLLPILMHESARSSTMIYKLVVLFKERGEIKLFSVNEMGHNACNIETKLGFRSSERPLLQKDLPKKQEKTNEGKRECNPAFYHFVTLKSRKYSPRAWNFRFRCRKWLLADLLKSLVVFFYENTLPK